jgi:small-conductance mechanosensitive channel
MDLITAITNFSPGSIPLGRIGLFALGIILSLALRKIICALLKRPGKRTENFLTALLFGLAGPIAFLVVFTGFYYSLLILNLHGTVNHVAMILIQLLLTFTVIRVLYVVIDGVARQMGSLAGDEMSEHEGSCVHFNTFGDSSLIVDMVFFIKTVDYAEFLQARQNLNIKIMHIVQGLGLDFAFPSTTVYLEK